MAYIIEKPLEVCKDHFLLKIDINKSDSKPGQFANIKIGNKDPLLRRPFSIYDHNGKVIEIIFKVVGKGTGILKDIDASTQIDVIAPLGKGFSLQNKKRTLLIGGGAGNAPLYYLAKKLKLMKNEIHFLYASKSKDCIYFSDEYKSCSNEFHISTDDGSEGITGTAVDLASQALKNRKYDIIYTCGPLAMMKNIVDLAVEYDIPVEVSVENYFGCGLGLCWGCTIETTRGMIRACKEGPVFDGRIILWDKLLR